MDIKKYYDRHGVVYGLIIPTGSYEYSVVAFDDYKKALIWLTDERKILGKKELTTFLKAKRVVGESRVYDAEKEIASIIT